MLYFKAPTYYWVDQVSVSDISLCNFGLFNLIKPRGVYFWKGSQAMKVDFNSCLYEDCFFFK